MTNETYDPWQPTDFTAPRLRLAFESMRVVNDVLQVDLRAAHTKQKVVLVCRPLPLLVRMVNESHRLASLEQLPKTREGSLYVVRNSKLLSSFHEDALGIYESDPLIHIAIITDEWIDLIMNDFPQLTIDAARSSS